MITPELARAIDEYGRAAAARGGASVATVIDGTAPTTIAERAALCDAIEAALAGSKKGVENANRISQRFQAEADAVRRELEATRPRTDALYEVLGAARKLMADQIWMERARPASGEREARLFDRNDALQRLRDTLFETRGALLRLPGAGGGERTGSKEDAARANAASGRERPAAPGRTGDATGEVIAGELAPAGPGASSCNCENCFEVDLARKTRIEREATTPQPAGSTS